MNTINTKTLYDIMQKLIDRKEQKVFHRGNVYQIIDCGNGVKWVEYISVEEYDKLDNKESHTGWYTLFRIS